jgi:hypothetical protein
MLQRRSLDPYRIDMYRAYRPLFKVVLYVKQRIEISRQRRDYKMFRACLTTGRPMALAKRIRVEQKKHFDSARGQEY